MEPPYFGCLRNMACLAVLVATFLPLVTQCLDNKLARTPPMGWQSSPRFTCNVKCTEDPANCVGERLYREMADKLVADGYKALGYTYIIIGDCWMEKKRDNRTNKLVEDKVRFPKGIAELAKYVHSKGLNLGIYHYIGSKTCGKYNSSEKYFDVDIKSFSDWGVDMLQIDGCKDDAANMDQIFRTFSWNATGKPMLLSCKWPVYQTEPNFPLISETCNTWRNYEDVDDSWQSVLPKFEDFANNQDVLETVVGPGKFNDMDVLQAGNYGLSEDQAKAQIMLWAIMASPLIMSNDLRKLKKESSDLLRNKEIIAVSQDRFGKIGKQIENDNIENVEIWSREIYPLSKTNTSSKAIVFFSRNTMGGPTTVTRNLSLIGLEDSECYTTYNVLDADSKSKLCPNQNMIVEVNPSGATMIIAKIYNGGSSLVGSLAINLAVLLMYRLMRTTMQ